MAKKTIRRIYHYKDAPKWSKELGGVPLVYQLEATNRKYQDSDRYLYEQAITEEILQKSGVILGIVSNVERNMEKLDYQNFEDTYNHPIDYFYCL